MASLTVEVDLDQLTVPTTPTMDLRDLGSYDAEWEPAGTITTTIVEPTAPTMANTREANFAEISETVNNIIETIETDHFFEDAQWRTTGRTISSLSDDYGTFAGNELDKEDNCCPTCGVHCAWQNNVDYSHRICVPTIGPAKPRRIQDVFGSESGVNLHFDMAEMSEAERVATGGNIFRCQTVCTGNCALCMQPSQEQGPQQWRQYTGWDWCCNYCWKDLCWRYHVEYLEPNGHVNTLGRFLVFLEE